MEKRKSKYLLKLPGRIALYMRICYIRHITKNYGLPNGYFGKQNYIKAWDI